MMQSEERGTELAARAWWLPPRLRTDEPGTSPRRVTWLELFYDLVFVIVIGQLSHALSADISPAGLAHFIFLFVPAWWVWLAGTYYVEYWETDDISIRFIMFALMLPVVGLALFAHDALGPAMRSYALSYAAARVVLAILFVRVARHDRASRTIAWSYASGFLATAAMITLSTLAPTSVRTALWVAALALELAMPVVIEICIRNPLPHRREISKLPERFGLFTIIVLGETVVGVFQGLSGVHDITFGIAMTGTLGLAVAFQIWGIYFDFVARRRVKVGIWWEIAWAYLHLALVMSIVGVGACLYHVMKSGNSALPRDAKWLLVGATAAALIAVALIEVTLAPEPERQRHPQSSISKWLTAAAIVALGLTPDAIGAARLLVGVVALLLVASGLGAREWIRAEGSDS